MPRDTVRIVIADDHALFRQGLRSLLRTQQGVTIVGEADSLNGLAVLLEATPCDVLLLDLGLERVALGEIGSFARRAHVIVVTASELVQESIEALRAGASAIVFKRYAVESLMQAIDAVMAGGAWMPSAVQAGLAGSLLEGSAGGLTAREREIVRHVGLGMRNAEIAARLSISERTVKTHLSNIFPKLGVSDRVELALFAVRTGLAGIHETRTRQKG